MTFRISSKGVKNTESSEVKLKNAKISVGGDLVNEFLLFLFEFLLDF